MPLTFHLPPAKIQRAPADNPAECLATTGNLEFGLTIPRYNGIDITAIQAANVIGPTTVSVPAPIVVGGENFNAGARVTVVPQHNISWPMQLPPNPANTRGIWTAQTKVNGRRLQQSLEVIYASRGEVGKPLKQDVDFMNNRRLISARNMYTVHVVPLPSAKEFMDHIEFHECQHVADHRWLAERIIGWWDDWLTELQSKNITVVSKEGMSGLAIPTGFGYSVGIWRIISFWCRMAAQSGDLYHGTAQGAHPVLNISEITDSSVTVTVKPREIIRARPDLNFPRPHREMSFQTSNLNGNERALAYAAVPPNPFRDNQWRKVDASRWARAR